MILNKEKIQDAARHAFEANSMASIPECFAKTFHAALDEMIEQAEAALKKFQEIK